MNLAYLKEDITTKEGVSLYQGCHQNSALPPCLTKPSTQNSRPHPDLNFHVTACHSECNLQYCRPPQFWELRVLQWDVGSRLEQATVREAMWSATLGIVLLKAPFESCVTAMVMNLSLYGRKPLSRESFYQECEVGLTALTPFQAVPLPHLVKEIRTSSASPVVLISLPWV